MTAFLLAAIPLAMAAIALGLTIDKAGYTAIIRLQLKYLPISMMVIAAYIGALLGSLFTRAHLPPEAVIELGWDQSHPLLVGGYAWIPASALLISFCLWLTQRAYEHKQI